VVVDGLEVWLTLGDLTAMCDVVCALVQNETGLVAIAPPTIHRLRRAIESDSGRNGLGNQLIRTASDGEYRLGISINEIGYAKSFRELGARGFLSSETVASICNVSRKVKSV
jgi:hypothetical protein